MSVITSENRAEENMTDDSGMSRRVTKGIVQRVMDQLKKMAHRLEDSPSRACLTCIAGYAEEHLASVAELMRTGQIDPYRRMRLAECDGPAPIYGRPLRVGIFPITADPVHWGHILCALSAMTFMKLDKVVFVIAGTDPRKPWLSARKCGISWAGLSSIFSYPLFAYSPIALGTGLDGETNCFRLLALNPDQQITAFYIAGTDHCRWVNSEDEPDTLEKIEKKLRTMRKENRRNHTVSLLFLERGDAIGGRNSLNSFLDIHVLPSLPLSCSSTAIRKTLSDGRLCEVLAALPFAAYQSIQQLGLYANHGSMST
jgi:nicotinic acid mononucleotide adenylyltransferase